MAGNGAAGFSGDGGPATSAELSLPWGLFGDHQGNLFIADYANYRVRNVTGFVTGPTANVSASGRDSAERNREHSLRSSTLGHGNRFKWQRDSWSCCNIHGAGRRR